MDTQMIKKKVILQFIAVGLIIGSFLPSCYYDSKEELTGLNACDTVDVTYGATIVPILESQCYSCHNTANADILGSGTNLEGYDNLMGYVTASDPDNSSFYNTVAWVSGSSFMPKSGSQLGDCYILKIRAWINAGAVNN
jgi:hypothetical protein